MNKKELNRLKKIILSDEKALFRMMIDKFENEHIETDFDNYFFVKGNVPLCFVAHIDTVRTKKDKMNLVVENNVISNKSGILGADDRAGVYGLFKIYEALSGGQKIPSLLFTNYEETGGLGAKSFTDAYDKLEDVNLFIELDRKGTDEYVTYVDVSDEVEKYIESFGYISSIGSYSDIADLTEHYLIPAVNISIGYYSQHTNKERLVIDAMNMNIQRCINMVHNPIEELYPINPDDLWSKWSYGDYAGWTHIYDDYGYSRYKGAKACPTERDVLEEIEEQLLELNLTNSLGLCIQCGNEWADCSCREANMFEVIKFWLHQETEGYEDFGEYFTIYSFIEELIYKYGFDTSLSNWLYDNDSVFKEAYEDFVYDCQASSTVTLPDVSPDKVEVTEIEIVTEIENKLIRENFVKDFIFCSACGFEWVNCACENREIFQTANNFLVNKIKKLDCAPRDVYYQFISEVVKSYDFNVGLFKFLKNNNLHFKGALLEYEASVKYLDTTH